MGSSTTTTTVVSFGEHELPSPISVLEATADRLIYFAAGTDGVLEHVAVDVEGRRVAWRAPASRAFSPPGIGVDNEVIDDVAFRWEAVPGATSALTLHAVRAGDGTTLWRTVLTTSPLLLPFACNQDLCVPDNDGTVVIDRGTGAVKERLRGQGRVIGAPTTCPGPSRSRRRTPRSPPALSRASFVRAARSRGRRRRASCSQAPP